MKTALRVFPRHPKFPNFLSYPVAGGEDGTFPVGELSQEDAASLWDEWKEEWLDHVARKSVPSPPPARDVTGRTGPPKPPNTGSNWIPRGYHMRGKP